MLTRGEDSGIMTPYSESRPKSSRPNRHSTIASGSKLRDSCQACSISKVKCSKEKTTCSRCAKRGTRCEYFVTKRPGRKQEGRSGDKTSNALKESQTVFERSTAQDLPNVNSASQLQDSNWPLSGMSVSSWPDIGSPHLLQAFPQQTTPHSSSSIFSGLLSPASSSISCTIPDFTTEFDDTLGFPLTFSKSPSLNNLIRTQLSPKSSETVIKEGSVSSSTTASINHEDTLSIFGTSNLDRQYSSTLDDCSPTPSLTYQERQSSFGVHGFDSSCSCPIRAVDILGLYFSTSMNGAISSQEQSNDTKSHNVQKVILQNKQTLEALTGMLHCSCSQESNLIVIMALILSRVLNYYKSAAHSSSSTYATGWFTPSLHSVDSIHLLEQTPPFTTLGKYSARDEKSTRMTAQLVLSELHRVQRFLSQFSQKIKAFKPDRDLASLMGTSNQPDVLLFDEKAFSLFSYSTLDQIGPQLHKRLELISTEIINKLRGK
jgi:hypothetical protein